MSKIKKLIIGLLIAVVVIGATVAIIVVFKNKNQEKKTVNVFSVEQMMKTSDMVGNYNYISGMVTVDKEQKIYLTSTDLIDEVCVNEGDVVKAGDVILVYDVTSKSLQLESKRAQVEVARAAVVVAENELEKLNNTVPVQPPVVPPVPEEPTTETPTTEVPTTEVPDTTETPEVPTGGESATPTDATPQELTSTEEPTNTEQPASTEEPANTEQPVAPEADVTTPEGTPEDTQSEGEPEEITYTVEELALAIKEKKAEISRLTIDYQLQLIELQIMEYQFSTGEVVCNFDGVVKKVVDQETAILNNEPFIVISGTEGYTVETAIGELDLMSIQEGDMVLLNCYDNGMVYDGTITHIGDIPSSGYNYSAAEESFYPVTITINGGEDLSQGMYMEVMLMDSSAEMSDSFYIEMAMVRKENGNYYVMKEVDGKLVKSYVATGEILWGSMIEIKGGLSPNDYIAFPYSADAVEGVNTVQESIDVLYQ